MYVVEIPGNHSENGSSSSYRVSTGKTVHNIFKRRDLTAFTDWHTGINDEDKFHACTFPFEREKPSSSALTVGRSLKPLHLSESQSRPPCRIVRYLSCLASTPGRSERRVLPPHGLFHGAFFTLLPTPFWATWGPSN